MEPHYFRRLSLQIGAAYVILMLGAFAAIGFGLRSSDPRSAPLVHVPAVVFPTVSPSPAQTAGASPGATARVSAAPSATGTGAVPGMAAVPAATSSPAQPAVAVSYLVVAQYDGQFEGEVTVVNNGSAQISGWQIVVALPYYDQITSFWNAAGYVSNNILLLQPAADADAVPAGGTLSVFFTAAGPQATPDACAFNSVSCG